MKRLTSDWVGNGASLEETPIRNGSTTAAIVSNCLDSGNTSIKSMVMSSHALSGMGKG